MSRIPLLCAFACMATAVHAADAPAPAATVPATPSPMTVRDFVRDDTFEITKLSPTGKYVARTVNVFDAGSEKTVLVVQDRVTGKRIGHFNLAGKTQVIDFWWVNDERIVLSAGQKFGLLEKPQLTGELFATNADGSGQGILVGQRADQDSTSSHITTGKATVADAASLVATLPDDPRHAIVEVWPHDAGATYAKAAKMDVGTGQLQIIATAPIRRADFLTDLHGDVRFAWGSNEDNALKTYYRDDAKSEWRLLNDESSSDIRMVPLGFSADGRTAYIEQERKDGPDAVMAYDTTTHALREQTRDAIADPSSDMDIDPDRDLVFGPHHELVGVRYLDAKPRAVFFDENDTTAKLFRTLENSFPDSALTISDYTRDGNLALVHVDADSVPGDVYLFGLDTKKAVHMASHRDWIDPDRMGTTRAIRYTARDGLTIEGFLTIPNGSDGKHLPLVVNPHGGPIGVRDVWGFDGEVQLMASRGYAVLQVNYRGSSGRGRAFEHAGFRQWGGAMQDDVTDATKWAIAQGIADPKRICIYGASYGGYAALMGVAKEPDLYRCAIGYVGVYDLPRWYHNEPMQGRSRTNTMEAIMGSDNLDAISPVHLADRIKVPVMLAAGAEDEIAVPIHTEMMREALLKAGKSVDAKIYPGEGHGFFVEANREDFFTRMLDFLQRNIGGGGAPPAAPVKN